MKAGEAKVFMWARLSKWEWALLASRLATCTLHCTLYCTLYSVFPGLVFIEKLQNNDLTMTSFVALRRPNDDHFKVLRMTSFRFCVVLSHKF